MKKFWINHKGISMSPLLKEGDTILIDPKVPGDFQCGDIILFMDHSSKELTLHRLIAKPMKTKGDLSLYAEMNSEENCFGKAIGFKRGNIYNALSPNDSIFCKLFLYFSKLRMKGLFFRKFGRLCLIILTKVFEFCSEKTTLNHSEEQILTDL
jgi:hypothetical protein